MCRGTPAGLCSLEIRDRSEIGPSSLLLYGSSCLLVRFFAGRGLPKRFFSWPTCKIRLGSDTPRGANRPGIFHQRGELAVIRVAGAEPEVPNCQPVKLRERFQLIKLTIWPYTCVPLE